MKKIILAFLVLFTLNSCSKDENVSPEPEVVEDIDIPIDRTVLINVEIPTNREIEDFILIDSKGRELPMNNSNDIKAETNTIVSLVNKQTRKIQFISYILKDDSTSSKENVQNKIAKTNGFCDNTKTVGVKSTAIFILANILNPISVFHMGNPNGNTLFEIYKSNVICNTFTEEQILNIETIINSLVDEGMELAEIITSSILKNSVSSLTGGLFADCWDFLASAIFKQEIEFDSHPHQDYENSIIQFNSSNLYDPYVITEFNNTRPNGIIIDRVIPLDNGNWKIIFDAYNSLPIPLGIRVGKIKDGTQFQVEPANNITDYIVKSNGSSLIQMIKNGITCEGFIKNGYDSYYTTTTGGLAVRSSDFDKIEVELEFNPDTQYVMFQGPNDNERVKAYHFLELCSHIIDYALALPEDGDAIDNKFTKERILLELVDIVLKDPESSNLLKSSSPDFNAVFRIIGNLIKDYIENGVDTVLSDFFKAKNIPNKTLLSNLKFINIGLDLLDKSNYLDAWNKVDSYSSVLVNYELYIPSDKVDISPVSNPSPENGATNAPLSGDLSFTAGANTPSDAIYRLYYGTTNNPNDYYNLEGTNYTYTGVQSNTTYYWKVETISNSGNVLATTPVWSFTTENGNNTVSPATPNNPKNGDTDVTLDGSITWFGGSGTPPGSTYRLYFDNNPNPLTEVSINEQSHTYSNLLENTTYYWKVETIDNNGAVLATSPIWSFTTENSSSSNIYDGDVLLQTQQEVDDFGAFNYTEITGSLTIGRPIGNTSSTNITDLSSLSSLTTIESFLKINYNDSMTSLGSGLNNLNSFGSGFNLMIHHNENLINLSGFGNISIYALDISGNLSLTSLLGIESINMTNLGVSFSNISSLEGISNAITSLNFLTINDNDQLLNLDGLTDINIQSILLITNNNVLNDFCALTNSLNTTLNTYDVSGNAYNPSQQDIIDGNCNK